MPLFSEHLSSISRTPEEIEEEKEQRKREADRTEIKRLAPILLRIITRNIEEKAKSDMYSLVNGQRSITVECSFGVLLKYIERRLPDPFVTCETIAVKRGRGFLEAISKRKKLYTLSRPIWPGELLRIPSKNWLRWV